MADRIQQRRDTAARWTQFNPILLEGEVGYELDTDQYKVGDGVNAWNNLGYRGDPCVQKIGSSQTTAMSQKATTQQIGRNGIIVGPIHVEQISQSETGTSEKGVRITIIGTGAIFFDIMGGYRTIAKGVYEFKNAGGQYILLSSSDTEFEPVDLSVKGNGENVYPMAVEWSSISGLQLTGYPFFGLQWEGYWYPSSFLLGINGYENANWDIYDNRAVHTELLHNNNWRIVVEKTIQIIAPKGGYYELDAIEFEAEAGGIVYLSMSADKDIPVPNITTAEEGSAQQGTVKKLFFRQTQNRVTWPTATQNQFPLIGYITGTGAGTGIGTGTGLNSPSVFNSPFNFISSNERNLYVTRNDRSLELHWPGVNVLRRTNLDEEGNETANGYSIHNLTTTGQYKIITPWGEIQSLTTAISPVVNPGKAMVLSQGSSAQYVKPDLYAIVKNLPGVNTSPVVFTVVNISDLQTLGVPPEHILGMNIEGNWITRFKCLQFQEGNYGREEFIIVNQGAITRRNANAVTVIAKKCYVFDSRGGFAVVQDGTWDLGTDSMLMLSAKAETYESPKITLDDSSAGRQLYFVVISRDSILTVQTRDIIAFNWTWGYESKYPAFQITNAYAPLSTSPIQLLDWSNTLLRVKISGSVLNINSGQYISGTSDTTMEDANDKYSIVALSSSATEFLPITNETLGQTATAYPFRVTNWQEIIRLQKSPILLFAYNPTSNPYWLDNDMPFFVSMNTTYPLIANKNMAKGKGADVEGIRSIFFDGLLGAYLHMEGVSEFNLKDLWIDEVSVNGGSIVFTFGSFTNPTLENNGAGGIWINTYKRVAQAALVSSGPNLNIIHYELTPLNNSGLYGHLQFKRSLWNYFYNNSVGAHSWKAAEDGSDVFAALSIKNVQCNFNSGGNSDFTKNEERMIKGIMPPLTFNKSPLDLNVLSKLEKKDDDVTIVLVGDSISTNNGYASIYSDGAYRPPRMDEACFGALLHQFLAWKGQEYRRYDANTEQGGSTPMFTNNATTAQVLTYDLAWDWQSRGETNWYKLPSMVLTGTNVSVQFKIPAGMKRVGFIYRTDYLWAPNTTVTIAEGNSKARIRQDDGTLVEANGYSFSGQETDEIIHNPNGDLRKSVGQKRLNLWIDDISSDLTVTIQNVGDGRLDYWGVEMSPFDKMFYLINVSRGGHNVSTLQAFQQWDIIDRKPDLILMQCCMLNEGAFSVGARNTPQAIADIFKNWVVELAGQDFAPEIIPFVLFVANYSNTVDPTTGKYKCSVYGGQYVDVYKFYGYVQETLKTVGSKICFNFLNKFMDMAYRKAEIEQTNNILTSAIQASGQKGDTFTVDGVHFNDYGSEITYRLLREYLNI